MFNSQASPFQNTTISSPKEQQQKTVFNSVTLLRIDLVFSQTASRRVRKTIYETDFCDFLKRSTFSVERGTSAKAVKLLYDLINARGRIS